MMGYLEFVILFKFFIYLLEFYIDLRQYKKFKSSTRPADIHGFVSEEDFKKSQAYQSDKMEFHLLTSFQSFITDTAVTYFFIIPYVWEKSGEILD